MVSPPTATLGYLPQEHERRAGETVLAALARRTGVAAAQAALDAATDDLTAGRPGADDDYGDALEQWLALGGADLEDRAEEVVAEVAPGVALDAPMAGLSGGQAARVGLAALLLSRYDVLLLDEPTNDLDLAGLDQLERFVTGARAGIVVVSHDREFLARTVTRVVELDLAQQLVRVVDGGYEAYLAEREVARRHAREEYEEYADTKASTSRRRARMQRNWMAKGVRDSIKKSKDGDKHIKATNRGVVGEAGAPRRSRPTGGSSGWRSSRSRARSGSCGWRSPRRPAPAPSSPPCAARVVRRGGFTLGPLDLQVDWGDRVAITGANGSGKSTLLAALLGRVPLDEGTRVARARRCGSGEIDQARGRFFGAEQLLDAFSARGARLADRGGAHPAGQVRADRRARAAPGRRRCRPGSAPAPRWRCCRRAGSTCWCSTSRPTTSTCRRSSSWSRRWPPTPARCCW